MSLSSPYLRNASLKAVLGPTNTGKTYYAIEGMLAHKSGMIGLPLRLLAREVYDKLCARAGERHVALVTGEEKITPKSARYWVSTVEAMPLERQVDFVAIDEIQLAGDLERGRIFTARLLAARGLKQTLFLGSETMRPLLRRLFPEIEFVTRERFSSLSYQGSKKVSRLPRRSAIVGFSSDMVYSIAELVRRQRGGAAVVLGALSPRTRNAQAALYQSGEVDYLIATDAIGMGLNMDIDHVAFTSSRKFDGRALRELRPDELAQIAGRAGRHIRNGSFGVTADCAPFDDEIVGAIEDHQFDPLRTLQWRSEKLDFSSLHALRRSLDAPPPRSELSRSRPDDDERALARLTAIAEVRDKANGVAALSLLWDICQMPDFRKVAPDEHAGLIREIFDQVIDRGGIDEAWLTPKVERLNRTDGDIDAISKRIAYVRTWTYLSHRPQWLENASYWQEKTRAIEDSLSDALHEKLTQRFVDRRTSVLLKKLRDDEPLLAGVNENGEVIVEGQFVGRLLGFEFVIDPRSSGADAKRMRGAADKALKPILATRAAALATAEFSEFAIKDDASIWWRSSVIATLQKGPTPLRPSFSIRGLSALPVSLHGRIQDRLTDFLNHHIEKHLGDIIALKSAVDAGDAGELSATARGVGFRLIENFGAMSRTQFGDELKQLDQEQRAKLRRLGMRFGEYTLFFPSLLKPAPAKVLTLLWSLWTERNSSEFLPPKAGLVSFAIPTEDVPHAYYYASGYRPSGARAVRIDMLERLANQIRADRKNASAREGFEASAQMMSFVGCSGEDFEGILKSLGYRKHTIKRKASEHTGSAPASNTDQVQAGDSKGSPNAATPQVDAQPTPKTDNESKSPDPLTPIVDEASSQPLAAKEINQSSDDQAPRDANASTDANLANTEKDAAPAQNEAPSDSPQQETAKDLSAAEDAAPSPAQSPEEVEVTVWRFVPRRSPPKHGSGKRAAKNDGAARRADGPPKRNAKGPKGKSDRARNNGGPRRHNGPRREKVADPNSPFAVLAALKEDLTAKKDKPEKPKSNGS